MVQDRRKGSRDIVMRLILVRSPLPSPVSMRSCTRLAQSSARMAGCASGLRCARLPCDSRSPPTPPAAVLRDAGCRSARLYLVEAKIERERQGFEVNPMLQHAITDTERAVQRSLRPAGKAGEIRPDILNSFWSVTKKHPTKRRPLEPAAGIHAWSFAAAFLLREVELCCLSLDEERVSLDSVKRCVTLRLLASEMDP